MRKLQLLSLLFFVFVFILSCKKDKEGSLTIHFVPTVEGLPLQMFQPLDVIDGLPLQFTHLSLLVSDLQLLNSSESELLDDIELVNMSFDDIPSASEGYTIHVDGLPARDYNGIRFGIGVPPELNNQKPADFPSGNPLSNTSYYWEAWDSYIFMKIEGRIDTVAPVDFETSFALHTGSNPLYVILENQMIPISIQDGVNTELTIAFDYALLLNGVDIPASPQNHNPADTIQLNKIVNNLQSAITLFQ